MEEEKLIDDKKRDIQVRDNLRYVDEREKWKEIMRTKNPMKENASGAGIKEY